MQTASPERLATLRDTIARLERGAATQERGTLPFGPAAIDAVLPGGGLPLGALHEIAGAGADAQHGAAAALFAAGILARLTGPVLWVLERQDLFAPGLAAAGLHPDRVIYAEAGRRNVLLVMEEGLRHRGVAAVAAETSARISLTASRRLQLAAEASGTLALLLRRPHAVATGAVATGAVATGTVATGASPNRAPAELAGAVAAVTRWRLRTLPSPPAIPQAPDVPGLSRARWQLELLRCRGGRTGTWIVEACNATGRLDLVAPLADRSAAPHARPGRAAA